MIMTLAALGERRIIEIIQKQLDIMPEMPIPFGDDVSAYDLGNGKMAILKTDFLVDETDVPPSMSLRQAARKAVIMNISDFAAKGVNPLVLLVSLALPREMDKKDIEEIGKGLNSGAREYGTYIIGGDTGEASNLIINPSVFGITEKGRIALRSGAIPGDLVAVTGFFGNTSAGLKILTKAMKAPPALRRTFVNSVLMPHARLTEGLVLAQTGAVSAAIDSSDGLAWSLHEISKASNVGFLIDRLPTAHEAEVFAKMNRVDSLELAMYGGEEYELVLTIKPRLWQKAEQAIENVGGKLMLIGKATSIRKVLLAINGKKKEIEARGYEHFVS